MASELIQTAHRFRNLGHYAEAHEYYCRAVQADNNLRLSLDFASMLVEQGMIREGQDRVNTALSQYRHSSSDDTLLALAEMFQASLKSSTTLRVTDCLKTGIGLYENHLLDLPVEDYKKELVQMLGLYLSLISLANLCGIDPSTVPVPSQQYLELLFQFLLRNQLFWQALQISKYFSRLAEPSSQSKLLLHFVTQPIPNLEKANAFEFLADLSHDALCREKAVEYLESARALYEIESHVFGPCMVDIQMIKLRLPGSSAQREQDRLALITIKQTLRQLKYPYGVRQAIMTLYEVAQEDQDDTLRTELDHEMHEMDGTYSCPLPWIMAQYQLILHWDLVRSSSGKTLLALEAIWNTLKDSDVSSLRIRIASNLSDKYFSLGNELKGQQWEAEAHSYRDTVPRRERFMHGTDVFYHQVQGTTVSTLPEEKQELDKLSQELKQVLEDVNVTTTPPQLISQGIEKVLNLCAFYTVQHKIRGFPRSEKLVETCLEYSDRLICHIPQSQRALWEGNVLQTKGTLLVHKANSQGDPKTYPANLDKHSLLSAAALYEKASRVYYSAGFFINFAMVQQQIATCSQMLWHLEARSPGSRNFRQVVQSRESAGKILKKYTRPEFQRPNELALLGLWSECHKFKVEYVRPRPFWRYLGLGVLANLAHASGAWKWLRLPQWIEASQWFISWRQFLFRTPYEEATRCLTEAEILIDEERQDLSVLGNEQALLAKQNLSRQPYMSTLHETAVVLLGDRHDEKALWEWIQRNKARSLSDMLGLGYNLPIELKARIEADPEAKELINTEAELVTQTNKVPATAQFLARKELEGLRKRMRLHDDVRQVLELREGKPVSWTRLKNTSSASHPQSPKRTWYVDWFIYNGLIFLIVVSDEVEDYRWYPLALNVAQVQDWVRSHVFLERDRSQALNEEHSLAALACLMKLVQPLLEITQKGDLLVLCMADILHQVPIHAAIVQGDPEKDQPHKCKTLLERNPIIYTSSMTIFEQCTSRALTNLTSATPSPKLEGIVLSVYEDGKKGNWKAERGKWYDMCEALAEDMGWGEAIFGAEVTKARIQTAFEASILHFSGHFYTEDEDVLSRGIVLASQSSIGDGKITPERVFSARDVFGLSSPILSSHVSLVACSSVAQAVQTAGDEPLGFVTALLIAGATSVMGTLWHVDSGTGRAFCEAFYDEFETSEDSSPDNDISDEKNRTMIDLAVAWQSAVKKMRGKEKFHLPYHWAGFVVHGTFCYPKRACSGES